MPCLKPVYDRLPENLSSEFQFDLCVLAGIAKNYLNDAVIHELSFIFHYEVKEREKKK